MSELIVVTGPPGAGKTTVAKALSSLFEPSARVRGDDFFDFIDRGRIPPWTTAAHEQNEVVVAAAATAAGQLAAGGYTVIYDGVIGPWFLGTFAAATTASARLHYAMLLPAEHVCVDRVRNRLGHGFTDLEAARTMYEEFATAAIDDRHVMTGTEPADAVASAIFDLVADGSLVWTTDVPPPTAGSRSTGR